MYSHSQLSSADILAFSLTKFDGRAGSTALTILLLVVTWVSAGLAFTADRPHYRASKPGQHDFWLALVSSGLVLVACAAVKASQLSVLGPFPTVSDSGSTQEVPRLRVALSELDGAIFALIALNGFLCRPLAPDPIRRTPKGQLVLGVIVVLGVAAVIRSSNLNPVRAGVCLRWAEALDAQQVRPASIQVFQRSIQLCPEVFFFRSKLAEGLQSQATGAPDGPAFNDLMGRAERVLIDAQRLSTLNRGLFHLDKLYTVWAAHESEPAKRSELARKASQALGRALIFEPGTESIWTTSANLDQLFLQRPDEASRKWAKAQDLIRRQNAGAFADYYLDKSHAAPFLALQNCDAPKACHD